MKTLSKMLLLSAVCCAMAICAASCEKEPQSPSQQDIESIKDGQMKWTALRAKEDGSTYATTFTWKKVNPADVVPYLYFEAVEDGATVSLDTLGTFNILPSIEFSTDAQNWTSFDFSNQQTVTLAKAGDKVFWRNTGKESFFSTTRDHRKIDLVHFLLGDKKVAVGGNVMSLIDKSCQSLTIPCDYCFSGLFGNDAALVSASELMLPATVLTASCYSRMFSGCTSLESAPELPAKELANGCYNGMFVGCGFEVAPELPATELVRGCYFLMFYGCENLKHVKVGFEDWGTEKLNATSGWLSGVSQGGTFECPEDLEIKYGEDSIPEGWTVKTR